MPFEMKTKKALDESQKAKSSAKEGDATKKKAIVGATAKEGVKGQEDALKPKEAAPKAASKLKETPEAKAAKKEAPKKEPPPPEKVLEKAADKKDAGPDYWAVREVVSASHNAAKLDEKKLKEWIKTAETMLDKADFSTAVDLRNSIERFQEAIEALKAPKGLDSKVINGFLSAAEGANKMDAAAVKDLIDQGETLMKTASKTQVKDIQGGLDKLYKVTSDSAAGK